MRAFLAAVILLTGCATEPEVSGPFANRLSPSDIQQIKAVVSHHTDVEGSVWKLEVVRPDRAHVETRHAKFSGGWQGTGLFVIKRGGRWTVDEHSPFEATAERIITVY